MPLCSMWCWILPRTWQSTASCTYVLYSWRFLQRSCKHSEKPRTLVAACACFICFSAIDWLKGYVWNGGMGWCSSSSGVSPTEYFRLYRHVDGQNLALTKHSKCVLGRPARFRCGPLIASRMIGVATLCHVQYRALGDRQ